MRRAITVSSLLVLSLLGGASPALAGIWTSVASGTAEDITAVDQRGPGDIVYATANGKIFRNGVLELSAPGVSFTDIALNPSGTVGLASAANGVLYRGAGSTWTPVGLVGATRTPGLGGACSGSPTAGPATPTGNLVAVGWRDDATAYVPATDEGVVLKTSDGGLTFADVSRQADGTCRAGTNDVFSDVSTVPGTDLVYLVTRSFGARWFSANGLTSSATRRGETAANCFEEPQRIAVDPANPNRNFVVAGCSGGLSFGFSDDAGITYDIALDYVNGEGRDLTGLADVAIAGGSALAVGRAGAIVVSPDGVRGYFQRADGADLTADWLAVDKASLTDAAVGGRGGRLVTSTRANAIPDVVRPTGTISGPTTLVAGQAASFTANLADEAGGSGINPASIVWSAAGLPGATGNPVSLTFPSTGFETLKVTFADNAGNSGEATLSVRVTAPVLVSPPVGVPPVPGPTRRTTTVTVGGGRVTLGVPRGCVPVGSTFTATLSFRRSRRKGANFVKVTRVVFTIDGRRAKVDARAPFRQRLTVRALRAGSRHTLRARATIKVRRGPNPKKSIATRFTVCG